MIEKLPLMGAIGQHKGQTADEVESDRKKIELNHSRPRIASPTLRVKRIHSLSRCPGHDNGPGHDKKSAGPGALLRNSENLRRLGDEP